MNNIGFIGMGNMAQAIASGWLGNNLLTADQVYAYAPHYDKLQKNAARIGFTPCRELKDMIKKCDTLIMACKPYQIENVLAQIKEELHEKTLLSIAAGWNYEKYASYLPNDTHFQYIMPNTPAMVGEGVSLFEKTNSLTEEEHYQIMNLFKAIGSVEELDDSLMKIGMAITGCGPAFVDLMIEALGDAGVKYGLPRKQAYALVSQMILGSAKLQLETGEHPGVLKDNVCSPAGTTIKGVDALEHNGIRAAFIDAIDAIM